MKPLKAIIWKELRENAIWPILVTVCSLYGWYVATWLNGTVDHSNDQNVIQAFLVWPMVLCPLYGLGIAVLQSVRELRRDHWAFLVHRPATRTTLFVGKTLA